MSFIPTPEQAQALDLFDTGDRLVIEAGAGTGKTATLTMLAKEVPDKTVKYVAFNRAIVEEARRKLPRYNSTADTAHSLAYQAVGRRYDHRLQRSGRMRSEEIAGILKIDPIDLTTTFGHRHLQARFLAGLVMRAVTVFCQTADPEPGLQHIPRVEHIDYAHRDDNNREVAAHVLPKVRKAWKDLCDRNGKLQYRHDHYLKAWALTKPYIFADVILFDEAQDASDVMLGVVTGQDHAQLVFVGDTCQQIYAWNGAVNALGKIDGANRTFLSQSFRFGPALADEANRVLEWLDADMRLTGTPSIPSRVGILDQAPVVLCRTNAMAVSECVDLLDDGKKVALVGGAKEILNFAWAAKTLKDGKRTSHPELACFRNWTEVLDFVDEDAQGVELKALVDLIDRFSPSLLTTMLRELTDDERAADVVVSTAHKSKGREWPEVRLAADFPGDHVDEVGDLEPEELRLLYVAVTRAQLVLDHRRVALFHTTSTKAVPTHV